MATAGSFGEEGKSLEGSSVTVIKAAGVSKSQRLFQISEGIVLSLPDLALTATSMIRILKIKNLEKKCLINIGDFCRFS